MIIDGHALYNPIIRSGENNSQPPVSESAAEPARANTPRARASTHKTPTLLRRRSLTDKPNRLRVAFLARQVGYLQIETFSHRHILAAMPNRSFRPNEVVPCGGLLCVIDPMSSRATRRIRHAAPSRAASTS